MSKSKQQALAGQIEAAYEHRTEESCINNRQWREAVDTVFDKLDCGELRVAHPTADGWQVEEWLKKAILLYFRFHPNRFMLAPPWHEKEDGSRHAASWFDKIDMKSTGWGEEEWKKAGFRAVPGAIIRRSAHIRPGAVLMPSFVNIGAYVGENTMIDTWATVGSCAQIGRDCHISGGAGIGGVLEPLQATPVIIEDGCFIGARSEIAEGVIVETGSVISMGVYIGASTKIVDRGTSVVTYGRVPAYSVVVPGCMPSKAGSGPSLYCAVIVKRVDARTRSKTSINQLLRDSG